MIHPTRDFYIALAPHKEWSTAHTAWGLVEDMSAVEAIVRTPYHEHKHEKYGTVMRMLDDPVPFVLELTEVAVADADSV
jgi:hypothetical protein